MHKFTSWAKCFAAVLMLAVAMVSANAQETTGSISGTITDSTGAAIRGATVIVVNTDRGVDVRKLRTGAAGTYSATSLPLGSYNVKIADTGFKTEVVTGLVLHVNDALTVSRSLVPGSAGETVEVNANQVQLNFQDASIASLISGEQATQLVLNNRNYEQLIQLQPGVAYGNQNDQLYIGALGPSGSSNTVAFSVNGGRTTSNNWTVDGADNVDRGSGLTLLVYPSVDAIREFKTLRGQYSAEFGRGASGQVNVVTKSGTNAFHGDLYEFFRNDALNANDYFNKVATYVARPKLRYNDFGGTIGGPVWIPKIYNGRDKTFFFFSYEGRRVIQYANGTAYVPTQGERTGDFSNVYTYNGSTSNNTTGPVNVCTSYNHTNGNCLAYGTKITNISTVASQYLRDIYSLVPLPNSAADITAGLDPHAIRSTYKNVFNDDQYIVRVDQQISSKFNVFYRYLHDSLPSTSDAGTFGGTVIPGLTTTFTRQPGTQHVASGTYVFSPTLLATMGYAYSTGAILTTPIGAFTQGGAPDVKPDLKYPVTLGVIPSLSLANYSSLGSTGLYIDYSRNHNAFGSVTKTWGRHTFKAGFSYDHYQKNENTTGGNQGSFSFVVPTADTGVAAPSNLSPYASTFAAFLLGDVNGGFSQQTPGAVANIMQNIYEGYVQDNWKATPRLTLDLGIRYSYFQLPSDAGGHLSTFDPTRFDASKAPTIGKDGTDCLPGTTSAYCSGLTPNANADFSGVSYINGLIFDSNNVPNHVSPYGAQTGSSDKSNIAPRFGFAFDVFGDGKTALRGGYGLAYDETPVSYFEYTSLFNPPATSTFSEAPANLDCLTTATASCTPATAGTNTSLNSVPGRVYATPTHYHTPYMQEYSLGIQQQLTPSFILEVGYVGNHGTHLWGLLNTNEVPAGSYVGKVSPTDYSSSCNINGTPAFISGTCDRVLNRLRPYQGYFSVDQLSSIYSSNYNGLQVKATKRFNGGSLIDVNYTWSRDLTNAQNDYSLAPQNSANPNAEYGRATYDRPDILTADYIWVLPWMRDQKGLMGHILGGWETSGIVALDAGVPLTAYIGTLGATVAYPNISGSTLSGSYTSALNGQTNGGVANDSAGLGISGSTAAYFLPDMIGNPNNGYGQQIHTRLRWFYTGAFSNPGPTAYRPGNEKRGSIQGPGFYRWDPGVFRNFKIREGLNFQLRAEAFNVLNHVNWAGTAGSSGQSSTYIVLNATATNFGQILADRDPRILQIAGKITF